MMSHANFIISKQFQRDSKATIPQSKLILKCWNKADFQLSESKKSIWKLSWLLQNCYLFMLDNSKQIDDAYEASNKNPLLTKHKHKKNLSLKENIWEEL